MSTRSQIRIIENGKCTDVYHHCDGYFAGVGSQLKKILQVAENTAQVLAEMNRYGGYEMTDGMHGDIDYWYVIDFDRNIYKGYGCEWPPWPEGTDFTRVDVMPEIDGQEMTLKEVYSE